MFHLRNLYCIIKVFLISAPQKKRGPFGKGGPLFFFLAALSQSSSPASSYESNQQPPQISFPMSRPFVNSVPHSLHVGAIIPTSHQNSYPVSCSPHFLHSLSHSYPDFVSSMTSHLTGDPHCLQYIAAASLLVFYSANRIIAIF